MKNGGGGQTDWDPTTAEFWWKENGPTDLTTKSYWKA